MKVFVYGTLKSGQSNHYLLKDSILVDKNYKVEGFGLYGSIFPFAIQEPNSFIMGEVYQIDAKVEMELDILEDVNLYPNPAAYKKFYLEPDLYLYATENKNVKKLKKVENGNFI